MRAGELVAAGAIGEVVHTIGLGPHRLRTPTRAPTGSSTASAMAASSPTSARTSRAVPVLHRRRSTRASSRPPSPTAPTPIRRACRTSATCTCATDNATGYVRVDWFTPDGLPTWGDGRLIILGTEGTSSSASTSTSPAGPAATTCSSRPEGVQHIDCSKRRAALRPPAHRRRARPHRDRDAAGALLQGDGAGADGAGDGRAQAGIGSVSMSHQNVAVVGSASAARTSSRATCPIRTSSRSRRSATSTRRGSTRSATSSASTRRTASFDDLLAEDDIDIIDICTPPGAPPRAGHGGARAPASTSICEKPLVGSLADVDEIIAAEKVAKGGLMPIFQYRYGNGIEKAKRIIDAGIAGKPYRRHGRDLVAARRRTTTPCPGAANGRPSSAACW